MNFLSVGVLVDSHARKRFKKSSVLDELADIDDRKEL